MKKRQQNAISKAKIIQAAPNVVFNALTQPEKITEWFQDEAILDNSFPESVVTLGIRADKFQQNKTEASSCRI